MIPAHIPPLIAARLTQKPDGICAWFAECENKTALGIEHPTLGVVRCCERCAMKVTLESDLVQIVEVTR